MATASPSLILLTGQNYVAAPLGSNLDGGVSISVAVVFDPALVGHDVNCTVISKHNPGAGKYGWLISYDATTGFVTGTIYDSAAGTNSISVVSIIPVKGRSIVVMTFSTTSTIRIYVNRVPADGVITGAVPGTIAFSNEPVAFGADSTSTAPQNLMKGGIYYASVWRVQLTASEVATIGADAVTPVSLQFAGYQQVLNYTSLQMVADSFATLLSWTDSVQALVASPGAVSGALPKTQLPLTAVLLIVDEWTTALADTGVPGGWPLTTTYALAAPFRMWANGATPPQTLTSFRKGVSDITIYTRGRRVSGRAITTFFELPGISLQYVFSTREMFAIIGDDQTGTLQNKRISFGFNIFNIEGVAADIALRVNSETLAADLFIGATKYTPTIVATNANVLTSRLILDQDADFNYAAIVPSCLSDQQVFSLISHNEVTVNSRGTEGHEYVDPSTIAYPLDDILANVPAAVAPLALPLGVISNKSRGEIYRSFTSSPYPVISDPVNAYVDPNPVIDSVTVDNDFHVTGVATAGPTDAFQTFNYWEITLEAGVSVIVIDEEVSTRFFAGRVQATNLWDVPKGSAWNGLSIRFVVQAIADAAQIWYSPSIVLNDEHFDNVAGGGGFAVGTYLDPLSSVQSVTVDALHNVTAVAMSGPILPDGSSATTHYWEIQMDTGAVYVCAGEQTDSQINGIARTQIQNTFKVPLGELWNCRQIRFCVRISDSGKLHGSLQFKSPWYSLQDPAFNNPGLPPQVVPIWPGAVNPVSDIPLIPPMAQDLYDVHEFTFHQHSILYPIGSLILETVDAQASFDKPQWFNNGADHPPGLYTITYTSGARFNQTTSLWNDFFQGAFGTGSRGLWVQSGMNRPYYVMQSPAFLPGGYGSQGGAEAAATGYSFIFFHTGGPLGVIFDLDNCSFTGSILLTLNDTQGIDIPGSWEIIDGPGSPKLLGDISAQYPTITGLQRGQTHLRYIVRGLDKKPRWQDCYVRVWPGPTQGTAADRSDPKTPKAPVPADTTGSAALIQKR